MADLSFAPGGKSAHPADYGGVYSVGEALDAIKEEGPRAAARTVLGARLDL